MWVFSLFTFGAKFQVCPGDMGQWCYSLLSIVQCMCIQMYLLLVGGELVLGCFLMVLLS